MTAESDSGAGSVQPPQPDSRESEATEQGVACDFCGQVVGTVRRVALDGDYERLRTRHQVQYSCDACFEKKERARRGAPR